MAAPRRAADRPIALRHPAAAVPAELGLTRSHARRSARLAFRIPRCARDVAEMLVAGRERRYLEAFFNARISDPSDSARPGLYPFSPGRAVDLRRRERHALVCQERATTNFVPLQRKRRWSKPPVGQQLVSPGRRCVGRPAGRCHRASSRARAWRPRPGPSPDRRRYESHGPARSSPQRRRGRGPRRKDAPDRA
jgi:hypothetical protein